MGMIVTVVVVVVVVMSLMSVGMSMPVPILMGMFMVMRVAVCMFMVMVVNFKFVGVAASAGVAHIIQFILKIFIVIIVFSKRKLITPESREGFNVGSKPMRAIISSRTGRNKNPVHLCFYPHVVPDSTNKSDISQYYFLP